MVEELRLVTSSGEHVPEDAEVLGSSREVTGSRRVFDRNETRTRRVSERVQTGSEEYVCGQRDLGNGYFEDRMCTRPVYETRTRTESDTEPVYRDEPVYGTVYRYRRWLWQHDTTIAAVSRDSVPPRWPSVRERRTRKPTARNEIWEVELRAVNSPQRFLQDGGQRAVPPPVDRRHGARGASRRPRAEHPPDLPRQAALPGRTARGQRERPG